MHAVGLLAHRLPDHVLFCFFLVYRMISRNLVNLINSSLNLDNSLRDKYFSINYKHSVFIKFRSKANLREKCINLFYNC